MNDIILLRRARGADFADVSALLDASVRTTWRMNAMGGARQELDDEVASRVGVFNHAVEMRDASHEQSRYHHFLLAFCQESSQLVGCGALSPVEDIVSKLFHGNEGFDSRLTVALKCIYIHPEHWRRGIGTEIFDGLRREARRRGFTRYVLDSGYPSSIAYWSARIGPPTTMLPNRWGPGKDMQVWKRKL